MFNMNTEFLKINKYRVRDTEILRTSDLSNEFKTIYRPPQYRETIPLISLYLRH
jgi:hypothetical protein